MLWVCAWKNRRSFASFLWILGEWVHCRITEFRISFIIERVIVGHRCKPWSCTFKASKGTYGINSYVLLFVLMLIPTIISINWFFLLILLRRLDGIQRNSQASIFRNTMVHRIFLYFLSEKREGLAFERLKFASSTTGPSEKQDTRTNAQARIIGLICRKGLGTSRADVWGNARHFCDGELN